jgi:phosphoglycerol transferase MdoB-like AlkP superfamily enzyme
MHGNNGDFWNRRIMHKNLGYDDLYAKDTYDINEVIGLGISDVSFLTQSVEKLKTIAAEHDKYYGTVITLSNHTPFSDTDKYGEFDVSLHETFINPETGLEEEVTYPYMEGTKLGNYFKSVHYADYALGIFFDLLEENGLLENTVIILYGDHDARLPKKDYVRLYNYDKENDDVLDKDDPNYIPYGEYQYELNRKTPLIIYSKDRESKSEKVSYIMGMYDVQPTIGNMFGFKNEYTLGHDIFNIKDKNIVVFPTGNWLTKEMYYNSQKNESYILGDAVIEEGYIENNTAYADNLLKVSNDILLYDLIKNSRLEANKVNENEILGEVSP